MNQLALFRGPQARAGDPSTSRDAAAAQRDPRGVEAAILVAFADIGPCTDDELCDELACWYPPTVKSARSRLSKRGLLVDTGCTRPSLRGCQQKVWQLA